MPSATQLQNALNTSSYLQWSANWLEALANRLKRKNEQPGDEAATVLLCQALEPYLDIFADNVLSDDDAKKLKEIKNWQVRKALVHQYLDDPSVFDQPLVQHDKDKGTLAIAEWFAQILVIILNGSGRGTYLNWGLGTDSTLIKVDPPRPEEAE
jgi:hypothetical protein